MWTRRARLVETRLESLQRVLCFLAQTANRAQEILVIFAELLQLPVQGRQGFGSQFIQRSEHAVLALGGALVPAQGVLIEGSIGHYRLEQKASVQQYRPVNHRIAPDAK